MAENRTHIIGTSEARTDPDRITPVAGVPAAARRCTMIVGHIGKCSADPALATAILHERCAMEAHR